MSVRARLIIAELCASALCYALTLTVFDHDFVPGLICIFLGLVFLGIALELALTHEPSARRGDRQEYVPVALVVPAIQHRPVTATHAAALADEWAQHVATQRDTGGLLQRASLPKGRRRGR